MPPVTDLPAEIILSIAEALPRNEILNLRNVCTLFSHALACKSLSRIIVNTRTSGGVDGLHSLRTLAQESEGHPIREWAQIIVIQDFTRVPTNQESEALQWVQTLSRNLTQIRSLEWPQETLFGPGLPAALADKLTGALQPILPSLRDVKIWSFREIHLPILDGLSRLSSLTLQSRPFLTSETLGFDVYRSIYGALARSSDTLECLILILPPRKKSSSPIHELLEIQFNSFPKLRKLSLEVQMDLELTCKTPSLSPQLSSLQALHLSGGQRYSSKWPSEEQNIFSVLRHSEIYLKEISSHATLPLFQYLASYQDTLEQLVISDSYWGPSSRASAAGFNSALAEHKSSLRELTLSASLDDGWALGDNNQDLLKDSLPALGTLAIPVFVKNNAPSDEDYLGSCLERALDRADFPLLRHVSVDVMVDNASMRGVGTCGRYYPSMHKECTSTAFKRLHGYRFKNVTIPPTFAIGTQDFYPSLGDDGWQYKPRAWKMKNLESQW